MVFAKRQGRQVTVYLGDDGRPVQLSSFEDTPPEFPFTARQEEIEARFGRNIQYFDMPDTAKVSGAKVSDEQVLRSFPEAKKDMGKHVPYKPGEVSPSVPVGHVPSGSKNLDTSEASSETKALAEFRDMMRRFHYARGKERKELERDLIAVASFLIAVDPSVESVLQQIKLEETSEKRRFTL